MGNIFIFAMGSHPSRKFVASWKGILFFLRVDKYSDLLFFVVLWCCGVV